MLVTCKLELGSWTIRLNGHFVADFWFEKKARRFAMNLVDAIAKSKS